jgi:hypothetical protein
MKTEKRKVTCRKGHFIESQSPEQPKTDPLQGGDQKDTSSINFICNHSFTTPESGYVFCIKCKKQFTLDINTPFFGNSGAKVFPSDAKKVPKPTYHLNCDKCGKPYWSEEGFLRPQLCEQCQQAKENQPQAKTLDKQIREKQEELIEFLDNLVGVRPPISKSEWKDRQKLYDELSALKEQEKEPDSKSAEEILHSKFPNACNCDWYIPIKECMHEYASQGVNLKEELVKFDKWCFTSKLNAESSEKLVDEYLNSLISEI